jgi:hypothetical protein
VDDLKSSYVNPKVNDKFLAWLKTKYGSVLDYIKISSKYQENTRRIYQNSSIYTTVNLSQTSQISEKSKTGARGRTNNIRRIA